jgi:hypothetical protein
MSLLSEEEMTLLMFDGGAYRKPHIIANAVREAQHAKDQEEIKELKEQVDYMHEAYEVMCEVLETDCQKRIEQVFNLAQFTVKHEGAVIIADAADWGKLIQAIEYLAKIKEE